MSLSISIAHQEFNLIRVMSFQVDQIGNDCFEFPVVFFLFISIFSFVTEDID